MINVYKMHVKANVIKNKLPKGKIYRRKKNKNLINIVCMLLLPQTLRTIPFYLNNLKNYPYKKKNTKNNKLS